MLFNLFIDYSRRASDDIPLLTPSSKNTVYENPFIIDKTSIIKNTNSNEAETEKWVFPCAVTGSQNLFCFVCFYSSVKV